MLFLSIYGKLDVCQAIFRLPIMNIYCVIDIGSMMRVTQLSLPGAANCVSWTNKPISFYLHVVDRSKVIMNIFVLFCFISNYLCNSNVPFGITKEDIVGTT